MSGSATAISGLPAAAQPGINLIQPWTAKQLNDNAVAGGMIRNTYGKRFDQQIQAGSFTPVSGQPFVVNVNIQPVGLITKFVVEMQTTITNPAGGAQLNIGRYGPFSTLSQVSYTDPNQNTRINTSGAHLAAVTARRHRRVPGAALATDTPSGFGSVIQPIAAPSTIAANATAQVNVIYEIPLAIGRNSTKGGVFAGAVFATQQLQLTFNAAFCATGAVDPLFSVYTGAAASPNQPTFVTNYIVWQQYWDQFPLALLNAMSPDLSTIYELKQTSFSALIANQDNYVRFNNLRQFLSTLLMYSNNGNENPGTDINYFRLVSANQTTEWQRDAYYQSYLTRNAIGDDYPQGSYMFDFSEAPIITAAEGNTVLSMNPSTAPSGSVLYVGWEDLATSTVLASASSLSGNAGLI